MEKRSMGMEHVKKLTFLADADAKGGGVYFLKFLQGYPLKILVSIWLSKTVIIFTS